MLPLALALLFLLAAVGGAALLFQRSAPVGVEVSLPQPTPQPSLRAYISGAVMQPGVYTVSEGDRLDDLLRRAGGAADDAELAGLNLAARVHDEAHFYVPTVGEDPAASVGAASGAAGGALDLNAATAAELQALPGIGEVKANAIVNHRERAGRFAAVEDVLAVPGIGPATLNGIAGRVTVR